MHTSLSYAIYSSLSVVQTWKHVHISIRRKRGRRTITIPVSSYLSIFYFSLYFGAVKEKEETHRQTHSSACVKLSNFSEELDHRKKKRADFIVQNLDYKQFFLDNVWVSAVLEIDFLVSNRGENKLFLTLMAYLSVKKKFRYLSWSWLSCNIKFSGMQNLSIIYSKLTQSMCLRLMKRCNFFIIIQNKASSELSIFTASNFSPFSDWLQSGFCSYQCT